MLLSVACATFNEENNIGKLLESLDSFADEVIIVDGSSNDNTVNTARKHKAKVIITSNPANFHINKQKAISLCKGKWILQIDADEILSDDLKAEIKKTIINSGSNDLIKGYWIPRKNFFLNRFLEKGGQYPDYTLRLYKNGFGKLPCKNVHEQAEVNGKTGKLINPILHYPYPDFAHYLDHFNKYTDLFSEEISTRIGLRGFISYFIIKPWIWFLLTFFRHKGFYDGFSGFIFSFFSSLRFPVSYIKYWEKQSRAWKK